MCNFHFLALNTHRTLKCMLFHSLTFSICSTGTKASFYDVNSAAENDGFTGQFSCQGKTVPSNNLYAAVASSCFDSSMCGKSATLTYKGKTIQVPILDECASCDAGQIDVSTTSWKMLEPNTEIGILDLQWNFGDAAPSKPAAAPLLAPPAGKPQKDDVPVLEPKVHEAKKSQTVSASAPKPTGTPSSTTVDPTTEATKNPSPSDNSTVKSDSTDAGTSTGNDTSTDSSRTNSTNKHPKSTKNKGTYSNAMFVASTFTLSSIFASII